MLVDAIRERWTLMSTISAVGLAGIAAKAGRICQTLEMALPCRRRGPHRRQYRRRSARLAPEAVGASSGAERPMINEAARAQAL